MNREIKFRAWDSKYECMDYNFFISNLGGAFGEPEKYYDTPNIEIDEAPDLAVMQYTGLKDKNGVEIYEGDIVNFFCDSESLNFVVSMIKGACFAAHRKSNDSDFYFLDDFEYLVIGNIYESPELLNP